jgi:hypothetical protein
LGRLETELVNDLLASLHMALAIRYACHVKRSCQLVAHRVGLSEPEREELEAELSTRHDWIREEGRQQREVRGLYQRRADQRISTTDPDATPMRLKSGGFTWAITPTMLSMEANAVSF